MRDSYALYQGTTLEAAEKLGGIKGSSRWKDKSRRKGTAFAVPQTSLAESGFSR
jgi:hypothetical protein